MPLVSAIRIAVRAARRLGVMAIVLALAACASGGGSPPGVDVPEPGQASRSTTVAGATAGQRSTGARPVVRAAGSAPLPIPAPAPTVRSGAASQAAVSRAPGQSQPQAPQSPTQPLAIEMEPAPPMVRAAQTPSAAADAQLADSTWIPAQSTNAAVNTLLAQADGARRSGNLEAAIATAERALRIAPSDPVVYYELAVLRLRQGDRARAEQLARKGISYRPDAELRQRLEDLLAGLRSS